MFAKRTGSPTPASGLGSGGFAKFGGQGALDTTTAAQGHNAGCHLSTIVTGGYAEQRFYVVQTNSKIIERCLLMTTDPGDLVLDATCGTGTTAYVAEQWGRRWITADVSRCRWPWRGNAC